MGYYLYDKSKLDAAGISYEETVYVLQESDVAAVFEGRLVDEDVRPGAKRWSDLTPERRSEYMRAAEKALENIEWIDWIRCGFDTYDLPYGDTGADDEEEG